MTRIRLGFVLFPDLTQLDLTGPLQVMSRMPGAETHIVAKSLEPARSDCGLSLVPTTTFAHCPDLDLLCAPGGYGVVDAMQDAETVAFLKRQGESARYITSVCTGAFLLGAAGLLRGKYATTHWGYTELLTLVCAEHQPGRVVRDGRVFTAGGVSSGIDFGLTIVAEMAGQSTAEAIQLAIEYDPAPPCDGGHPSRASAAAKALVAPRYAESASDYRAALARL